MAEGSGVLPPLQASAAGCHEGLAVVLALRGLVRLSVLPRGAYSLLCVELGQEPSPADRLEAEVSSWDEHHRMWTGGQSSPLAGMTRLGGASPRGSVAAGLVCGFVTLSV